MFLLEHEFNENLLQLLVDVVDAELFETVLVENFETVNIQHTNSQAGLWKEQITLDLEFRSRNNCKLTLFVHGSVNSSDQPVEDSVVNALSQGVTTSNGLNLVQRHLVSRTTLGTVLGLDGTFFEHVLNERRRNLEKSSSLIQS